MNGIVIIVVIATVALLLLVVYDKRNSIINFFKEKVFKPKKVKIPKYEEKPKIDSDLIPNDENLDYGELKKSEQAVVEEKKAPVETTNEDENIFGSGDLDDDEEEIDLDKIFEDLRTEQAKKGNKKLKSEILDESEPNFDNMSMEDLDTLLEDNLSKENMPNDIESYLSSLNSNLTGEELGKAIKNMPPQLKVLLLSDILKKKY